MKLDQNTFNFLTALAGLFVSCATLWIGWLTYQRDRGHIIVHLGLGKILSVGAPDAEEIEVLTFTVTNVGRRPVTLTGFYGFLHCQQFNRLVSWFLGSRTPECFKVRGFFLPQPIILQQLRPNGRNPTLQEGDSIQVVVDGNQRFVMAKSIATEAASLNITDTTGRCYWVPKKVLRKLKRDVAEEETRR